MNGRGLSVKGHRAFSRKPQGPRTLSRARFWVKTRCTPVVPGTQQRHLQAPARPWCGVPSARRGARRAQRGPLSASHPRHQGQPRPTSHPRDGLCKGREVSSCHVGTSGAAHTGPSHPGAQRRVPPRKVLGRRTEVVREAFAQTEEGPTFTVPPTRTRTRADEGRRALLGSQEARGAHPAQALREGLRVRGRPSCSSRSGLALRAGLGRQGAQVGRGSLEGPGHGKHRTVTACSTGRRMPTAPHPARPRRRPTGSAGAWGRQGSGHPGHGSLTRRLSRSPPNPDPSMSMKV